MIVGVARPSLRMRMPGGPCPPGPLQTPGGVSQAETDQQPKGEVGADRSGNRRRLETGAQPETHQPEADRTDDLAEAAAESDSGGFAHRPAPGFRQADEGKIMIRSGQGVHQTDQRRVDEKQIQKPL